MRFHLFLLMLVAVFGSGNSGLLSAEASTNEYLAFVRAQARSLRNEDRTPLNLDEWQKEKTRIRKLLSDSWGAFPNQPASLEATKLGELKRDGYRVEKIIFQTFPGVWMTANAYVPDRSGKLPALLMVHGHWRGAKQDPVVQARCIGAAKLGFFVLVVDAFGAGERGVGKALGEYHGEMTAATLLPTGLALSGLQVYENVRAMDYLGQRPEVDPERIGITGASGGGNQSMYAGAWDERLAAVVPVCSVGNYQAYLGAACCLCEVVPGALKYTEEWGVLGMIAPRGLMVINATRDSRQFSVEEAKISLRSVQPVFDLFGKSGNLRHSIFESGHDYSQPMREAVYGWMAWHLKGQGEGNPIAEPNIQTEDPETLRCFPGQSRPDDWITIPKFAAAEGKRLISAKKMENSAQAWLTKKRDLKKILSEGLLGGIRESGNPGIKILSSDDRSRQFAFSPEPGIRLTATQHFGSNRERLTILVDLEGGKKAAESSLAKNVIAEGASIVTLDLRATGQLAWPGDKIGRAPDHTTAEWGLWIGRPLLGQWVCDLRRLLDTIETLDKKLPSNVELIGIGPGGVVALTATALDDRITSITMAGTLASLITETPYEEQRLGTIVPGMLKHFGDIADLAALAAPRKLFIKGGVLGDGTALEIERLNNIYERTRQTYEILSSNREFQIMPNQK